MGSHAGPYQAATGPLLSNNVAVVALIVASVGAASSSSPGPTTGTVLSVIIFTLVWAIVATKFRAFWRNNLPQRGLGESGLVGGSGLSFPLSPTFRRQAPAAIITAGIFVAVAWLAVLGHGSKSLWVEIPGVLLGLLAVIGLILGV